MSTALAQPLSDNVATPGRASSSVCMFSLLGLTLSAVVPSCGSFETINKMFSPLG
jgi:hypothetical protein